MNKQIIVSVIKELEKSLDEKEKGGIFRDFGKENKKRKKKKNNFALARL
jgi:hypothetical protein